MEAEPIIKDENMQVVPVKKKWTVGGAGNDEEEEGTQIVQYEEEVENLPIDQLLSVKNWTMQSHEWKLFNAIFEMLTEEQFQYKCPNNKTIFENFSLLLKLALTKSDNSLSKADKVEKQMMTQVKQYIMSYSLPTIINKTLKNVNPEFTVIYLDLFVQAYKIEGHLRDYMQGKKTHNAAIQKLHL